MNKNKILYDLIKSLSKQEKRYFKLFASRHTIGEKNNYLKLFEIIDKQKNYDTTLVQKVLANSNFPDRIDVVKNYLYQMILKSLEAYHTNTTIESRLKSAILRIQILYEKKLNNQATQILKKAKKDALNYERYPQFLELMIWEKRLMGAQLHQKRNLKEIESFFEEEREVLDKLKVINDYSEQSSSVFFLLNSKGMARSKEELKKYSKFVEGVNEHIDNSDVPIQAKVYYYHTRGIYFHTKGDLINCYECRKKTVEIMEQSPYWIKENVKSYIAILNNFIYICQDLKYYNEFLSTLQKLRKISSKNIEIDIFVRSYLLEIDYFIKVRKFKKGNLLINEIEKFIKKNKDKIRSVDLLAFYHNFSVIYFSLSMYKESLFWLNRIFNELKDDARLDLYSSAKILNLIIHFELGNIDLLEYATKSTYRFLYKRNRLFEFEKSILKFIRTKIPKINTKQEIITAFNELKIELKEITKDTYENKVLDYFDIISWLESKIKGEAYLKVLKERIT